MSNDLEGAFAALSADAGRGRLPAAADLRRRADRRAVRRSLATAGAAAVLVAAAAGTGWALAGDPGPRPPVQNAGPAPSAPLSAAPSVRPSPDSPSPTSSPSTPSVPPSSTPPSSSAPPLPTSIPARAMLGEADGAEGNFHRMDDIWDTTRFCSAARYPSAKQAAVRASVMLLYRGPDSEPGSIPDDTIYDTVTVYRGDGARDFMSELRAAVRACPTGKVGDLDARYRSLGSFGAGDQSLLIERSWPARQGDGEPVTDGSRTQVYLAAVRVGDAVTLVDARGYENFSSDRRVVESLATIAGERLADWRG